MKKIYLSVLLVTLLTQFSYSQLTLTKSVNEPIIGDTKTFHFWDSTSALDNTAGTGVMWDFSTLTMNTSLSNSTYTTVSSTPSASAYPNATFAEVDESGGYTYWKSTSTPTSQLELLGIVQPSLSVNFNSNSAIAVVWPVQMGYNKTDAFSGTAAAQTTISLSGTASGNIKTLGSGTGTLMLPGSLTFTNVLQITSTQTINASFFMGLITATIVSTNYQYFHSSQKFPILTVEYQTTTGAFSGATASIRINGNVIAGINESELTSKFSISPNPAKDVFNLTLSNPTNKKCSVEIYNSIGQIVKTIDLDNSSTLEKNIPVSDLSKGIYIIRTSLDNQSSSKKLIID